MFAVFIALLSKNEYYGEITCVHLMGWLLRWHSSTGMGCFNTCILNDSCLGRGIAMHDNLEKKITATCLCSSFWTRNPFH